MLLAEDMDIAEETERLERNLIGEDGIEILMMISQTSRMMNW